MLQIDYDLVGVFLRECQVAFARSNKVDFNLERMFAALLNPVFPDNLISDTSIKELEPVPLSEYGSGLINMGLVKNFVSQVFKMDTSDYADLISCFPDAQFTYRFYQMTEYKWLKRMRKLIMPGVCTNTKLQVRLSVFDDAFVSEPTGEFKWRLLRDPLSFKEHRLEELQAAIKVSHTPLDKHFQIRMVALPSIDVAAALENPAAKHSWGPRTFDRVVIHIHGGGFISMSSSSHMVYLTKYARSANAVVFCIDYPLAPQTKYSAIIDCIFKAYLVITQLLADVFHATNYKLVLSGDSAGGNLACALTNWLLLNGMEPPEGLVLAYPVMALSMEKFTPSYLHALYEYVLNFNVLQLCKKCYLEDDDRDTEDFMISPLSTPDALLSRFPPTHLFVCDMDPLHDDGLRFASRMLEVEGPIRVYQFRNTPHGVLNLAFPRSLPIAFVFEAKNVEVIKNIFERSSQRSIKDA